MASKRKQQQVALGPPKERLQHGDRIETVPGPKDFAGAGIFCKVNRTATTLDVMLERDMLGNNEAEARRRYEAGMWLRRVHAKVYAGHQQLRLVNEYAQRGSKDTSGEISDVDAWNWKAWNDALKFLGQYAYHVRRVCVEDVLPPLSMRNMVVEGLDKIAAAKGF